MKKISFFLLPIALLAACQPEKGPAQQKLQDEISVLEKQLLQAEDASEDREAALQLIAKTEAYAKTYPQDTLTPMLLFKAGDVAKGAREYGKAVQLWGQVWRDYSKHPKAPMALFLQGFTFDSDLRDPAMATKYYKKFLTTFPNDTMLGPQVKQLLSVVEVKPEDLIKNFEGETE